MRIAIIGDYTPSFESHPATTEAIRLAAEAINMGIDLDWLPTVNVSGELLSCYDALWASPGSPYHSMSGMLHAIRFARERGKPMVAT